MDLTFFILSMVAIPLFILLTDFNFLISIMLCLCISYFIEAIIRGICWKDSFYGSASVIVIIVGLIVACFGMFLLPLAPISNSDNSTISQNLSLSNSSSNLNDTQYNQYTSSNESIVLLHQAINTSNLTQNLNQTSLVPNKPSYDLNALAIGLTVIGFGIAFFTYGMGNLIAIEGGYEFQELKTYVMEGPYFAKKFKKNLQPMDYFKIFGFWAIIGFVIIVSNIPNIQSTILVLIKFFVGVIIFGIGLLAIFYGLTKKEKDFADTVHAVCDNINHPKTSCFLMSIRNMDFAQYFTPSKILIVCGLVFLCYGYLAIFTQNPPSPIETMSFGLGIIGVALALK